MLAFLVVLASCHDGAPAAGGNPHAGEIVPAAPVGLASVRARGTLRVLTRNNGISYFVLRGRELGFDYELAGRLAEKLGVKLELVVPKAWGDLIPMLRRGEGDIIAAGMSVTPERSKDLAFTKPYALIPMRVVWGKGEKPVRGVEELAGKTVHVRQQSAYFQRLDALSVLLEGGGKPPIDIVIEGESLETEQILAEVAARRIPYTLCDEHICNENRGYLPNLVVGPEVSDPQPLAWAVHPAATDLLAQVDAFFASQKADGAFQEIFARYYQATRGQARKKDRLYLDASGAISPHDPALKAAAHKFNLDWRLLAAVAYQESHFDAKARTWTGGRGLFGLLPDSAKKLGVKDLEDPEQAALAAGELLAQGRFKFAQLPREEEQWRMALAAFHVGAEHVTQARLIAAQEKLDPDHWDSVARILPLMARRDYAARSEYGYVRGQETVDYVNDIWEHYRAYRHAMGERD